jgi:phosphatidylinositol alpha-1,6-mannosyltransferase
MATEMGEAGRRWVSRHWQWEDIASRLTTLLNGSAF